MITSHNADVGKISVVPYLYFTQHANQQPVKVLPELDRLPVNKTQSFTLQVKNGTGSVLTRCLQFGNRYVTANNILISSSSGQKQVVSGPTNTVLFTIGSREEISVSFDLNELNRTDPGKLHALLWSESDLEQNIGNIKTVQAFFLGLFGFLFLFNFIIYLVTKWKVYLKYSLYIFLSLLYFSYYFGLLQEIFTSVNNIPINLVYTWYSLIFISYFIFLNEFGDYKQHVPRAYKLLNIGIIFKSIEVVVNTALHFLGADFIYTQWFMYSVLVFEIILMAFILINIIRNKHVRGRIVIFASILLIAGGIIEQSHLFQNIENAYFIEFGITAELLVFSVGLGYITKIHYEEKREAERLYIQQLTENQQFQRDVNIKLEEKVLQKTDELLREKLKVKKKNAENELLLSEIHHRVKNNLQVISSLFSLQEQHNGNFNAKAALQEGKERIQSMELVHKMLYTSNSFSGIEMNDYVTRLSRGLLESFGITSSQVELDSHFDQIVLDADTAIPVGLILNELIVNALKHALTETKKLTLQVKILEENSSLTLKISDNGGGRASTIGSSDSFGLKVVRSLIRQLDGAMDVKEQGGLFYTITLNKYERISVLN